MSNHTSPLTISWQIVPVDTVGALGSPPQVASSNLGGQLGVAYCDGLKEEIRFAKIDADLSSSTVSVVDNSRFGYCCLKFQLERPVISYYRYSGYPHRPVVTCAFLAGNPTRGHLYDEYPWAISETGQGPEVPGEMSLAVAQNPAAVDPLTMIAISFFRGREFGFQDGGLGLVYSGVNPPTAWASSTLNEPHLKYQGVSNSLAFTVPSAENYRSHHAVAYSAATSDGESLLKYAVFDGHNWRIEGVHDPLASLSGSVSLAFNPKQRLGYPTVAYLGVLRGHSGSGSDLMYAERHRVGWNVKNIAGNVRSPCLAFTPAGEPAISYSTGYEVLYSVFGNGWTDYLVVRSRRDPETGDPIENFEWTSLAFNSATGAPVISYYDQTTRTISCAIGTVRNVVLG